MTEEPAPDLQDRLAQFNQRGKPRRRTPGPGLWTLASALGLGGAGIAYFLATGLTSDDSALKTSDVEMFQVDRSATASHLEFPPDETDQRVSAALIAVEDALDVPAAPAPEPSTEVLAELAKLREALAASQAARNSEIQSAVSDLREAFDGQRTALQAALAEKQTELANLQRQTETRIDGLQAMLEAERAQREDLEAELARTGQLADQQGLDDRVRLEEEQRLREAEAIAAELLTAQINSPAVVYAGRPTNPDTTAPASVASTGTTTQGTSGQVLSPNEQFLNQGSQPLEIQEASRIIDPDRTLAQGSVIQAALQTAINSDLPGSVVAVVSEPVPAFSGDRILIPRGSRLFGQYRSGVDMHQKRILILWTRVLTPDGTSMEIASVGGDPLGRSGLTGQVNTRFAARFGGAALISVIGAAPAMATESATNIVLGDVGSNLKDAVGSVIADQVSIAPTIYVDQGASVTVLVDRDVVIY